MKIKKFWIALVITMSVLNFSCSKELVYDPDKLIEMYVGKDKYLIPLKFIVRPDTGGYAQIHTDTGIAYFFWPSGRGLNINDTDPGVLEKDLNIIKINWTQHNLGITGNSMNERINEIMDLTTRYSEIDLYELQAYKEKKSEFGNITFIGKIYDRPFTILCHNYMTNTIDSYCQMDYVYPQDENHITLFFYGKNLKNWKTINDMAIQKLHSWYQS